MEIDKEDTLILYHARVKKLIGDSCRRLNYLKTALESPSSVNSDHTPLIEDAEQAVLDLKKLQKLQGALHE